MKRTKATPAHLASRACNGSKSSESYFGHPCVKVPTWDTVSIRHWHMVLNPRTCSVLIVHEETAPIGAATESPCSNCGCDCSCRFNLTQIVPILPIECTELGKTGPCGKCELCRLLAEIASMPAMRNLTHIYCAGIIVIQRGYLVPDYCNPILKGLFKSTSTSNPLEIEGMLYDKFGGFVKRHLLAKTLEMFKCGVHLPVHTDAEVPRRMVPTDRPSLHSDPLATHMRADMEATNTTRENHMSANLMPCTPTVTAISEQEHVSAVSSCSIERKIMPILAKTNTWSKHAAMSHGVHQRIFSSEGIKHVPVCGGADAHEGLYDGHYFFSDLCSRLPSSLHPLPKHAFACMPPSLGVSGRDIRP